MGGWHCGGNSAAGCIQVAGVADAAEASLLVNCGVDVLGFPLSLAGRAADLSEADAAAIIRHLPATVDALLITYLQQAAAVAALGRRLGVQAVQLHGEVAVDEVRRLRASWPGLTIVKSLVVGRQPLAVLAGRARTMAPFVDAFILDTFDPQTGACGATGKTHDWSISRRLVATSPKPVILAGGLHPGNVREAIRTVRPAGVDVHTGVEGRDGRKREDLVRAFVAEARVAFAALQAHARRQAER